MLIVQLTQEAWELQRTNPVDTSKVPRGQPKIKQIFQNQDTRRTGVTIGYAIHTKFFKAVSSFFKVVEGYGCYIT